MEQLMTSRAWAIGAVGLAMALAACTESYDLSLTYEARATPTSALTIDNVDGGVRLRKTAPGAKISGVVKIHASGFDEKSQAKAAAEQVEIVETLEGGELVLRVSLPPSRGKTFAVAFDLLVPEDLVVSVFTDNGRVSVDGLTVAELDTTNAEVDLAFTAAPPGVATTVRTNDGPVTADSHDGAIDVATSNASVELFSVAGNTRVSTTQGFITARVLPPPAGEIFLSTTNAQIDLGLPREFGARLLAVTSPPGVIVVSDLPFTPTASFPDQAEGALGNGAGRVDLRTTVADIFVHR
jgi:hypothetical protein